MQSSYKTLLWIGCGALMTTALFVITLRSDPSQYTETNQEADRVPHDAESPIDTNMWQMYTDEVYGFTLSYPLDWRVATSAGPIVPMITFYQEPLPDNAEPPLTHHDAGTHVSIYPEGIPTEGIMGETASSSVTLSGARVAEAIDYTTVNDAVWATLIRFTDTPPSWNQSGFVYAGAPITNLEMYCERKDGERIAIESCDPLGAPEPITVKREGTVDETVRTIQEAILESFRFTSFSEDQ